MRAPLVAAVDVGGTRVKAALVDPAGREVVSLTDPTPAGLGAPGALVGVVVAAVEALRSRATDGGEPVEVSACGVVVPGIVDDAAGVARWSANLGWRDLPVVEPLASALGVPVALGHDVRAGLVAEARFGAAQGFSNVLFMPIGTGIAGALMLDGHVVVADGWSGELGHVVVVPDGPPCGCGASGCLEAVASAAAIERAYAAASGQRRAGEAIAALVAEGDEVASRVWATAVDALARAVVLTTTLTGVSRVLVGGGLAHAGDVLLGPLRDAVAASLTFQRRPTIAEAALGDRAGCLGAACLAFDLA
ncbi:glucokinase [Pedococcus dokdonensis]|uniref:Glucokinase n=1 Tax=Pedococcus dokdonensis TaxID=443156 RepID=A0A1H0LH09_9MICO|nr:ROK family protein [Pedococcus dokdonensis]SDO67518.1 glucokinase [Pedococcus dokdonensis]